ncbi:MAG: hypothetical protein PHE55_21550 [Methylococcaceae bacterium]|nr:hypothetical protein [Methylococcaceae bacterium]
MARFPIRDFDIRVLAQNLDWRLHRSCLTLAEPPSCLTAANPFVPVIGPSPNSKPAMM